MFQKKRMKTFSNKYFSFKIFLTIILIFTGLFSFKLNLPLNIASKDKTHNDKYKNNSVLIDSNDKPYVSPSQYKIDILHYFLNIALFPNDKLLKGDVVITGILLDKNLHQIELNFYDNMKISKLLLNNVQTKYIESGTKLTIFLNNAVKDTFNVRVIYQGTPKFMGFSSFVFGRRNGQFCVFNLNEPNYASTWFPCNDIPSDKATYDIKITNDSSQVSASNGKLISIETDSTRRTYYWRTRYPTSTYLVCLYSSNYVQFSDKYISLDKKDTMSVEYYVFPDQLEEAKIDFKEIPEMISFFAKKFGEYPFIKEKYGVAEFLWQMGAMESQTLIGIGSNFVTGKDMFTDIYSHELAHHWFGDAVGPETWKDIWLNEGFASYCEALYAEYKGGEGALRSAMMNKFHENFNNTLYNPGNNLFGTTVYDKGAWVLHMLRHQVGDSVFFSILRNYYNKFKFKNASTKEFEEVCEAVSGEDLSQFFNQWIFYGTGILKLKYRWATKQENNNYKLIVNINQTQEEYKTYKFPLDIEINFENKTKIIKSFFINKNQTEIEINFNEKPINIILDPDNWLLASLEQVK
jgi:aminopeptidase N